MKLAWLLAFSPLTCVASLRRLTDLSLMSEELQPHKTHQNYYLLLLLFIAVYQLRHQD